MKGASLTVASQGNTDVLSLWDSEIVYEGMLHTPDGVPQGYSWSEDTGGGAGKRSKLSHSSPLVPHNGVGIANVNVAVAAGGGHHHQHQNPTSSAAMTSWDIDGGLAADFDGSLSGLGTELGTSSYNMR
ncbi:transcription factor CP2-like protein 1 isoform X4 [Elysia marginata]|uniref:Transcription factor CP2-like protein 1 isoform X4 n=1 Tax=Elysia marginata TaxID=1093978 RepID=A0AAV4II18_9GAST|nr:transcription factor CP2-like protein 1 isoform X4 [Elysia marginata]